VTTWPSDQTHDQRADVPTIAGYVPPTVASRAATAFDVTAPTAAHPYVPDLAWSAEAPEFAAPLAPQRPRPWSMRSGVLTLVGASLIAAAAAGIFGALHGAQSNPAVATNHSAPAPAPASAPAPAPAPAAAPANPVSTPGNQTKPATPTRSVSHGSSDKSTQQSPPQYSTPSPQGQHTNDQQWQSNHDSVSTPPTWNRDNTYYWFTHRRDHDGSRWTHDRDSDDRSSSNPGGNNQSSHDQNSGNHSAGSADNGSK
jgi:hypothetical protein